MTPIIFLIKATLISKFGILFKEFFFYSWSILNSVLLLGLREALLSNEIGILSTQIRNRSSSLAWMLLSILPCVTLFNTSTTPENLIAAYLWGTWYSRLEIQSVKHEGSSFFIYWFPFHGFLWSLIKEKFFSSETVIHLSTIYPN